MHFREDELENFLNYFESIQDSIKAMPGMVELNLYRDIHTKNQVFTLSTWKDESDLINYRTSSLFADVWPRTKALFSQPAQAWSLRLK
jgi:heme-degrading monooxygenase HmoA